MLGRYGKILAIVQLHAAVAVIAGAPMYSQADTSLVSVSSSGEQGNQISWRAAISADGRFVTFDSLASNLVTGDTNGRFDLFLHDRQTGGTNRVNVDSQGNQTNTDNSFGFGSSLSADGRFVGFSSRAPDLVPNDTNNSSDTFVHDTQTGETMRVSVSSAGVQGNVGSSGSSLSADGRFVAFQSGSPLVANDSNSAGDVFVHDRQTGETTRISLSTSGAQGDGASYGAAISGDGQFVAFASFATNLVADDTNGKVDIFVHNRQTGETSRVSVSSQALQADDDSSPPLISHDGRFVAYESRATNLVLNDTNALADVFVHDRQTGETSRVSVDSSGMQGTVTGGIQPSMSADGRYVAFATADKLVAEDQNDTIEVYLHDRQNSTTVRVSVDNLGNEGDSGSSQPAISGDGSVLAFQSTATNLVVGDTNGRSDVFVVGEPPPEPQEAIGLKVRCIHSPIFPQPGEEVTIIAEAVDSLGVRRAADSIEIFLGDLDAPVASTAGQPGATHRFTPSGAVFGYGCRAERATSRFPEQARSWSANELLRTVLVGTAAAPPPVFGAIPVFLNGPLNEKIDIVFFADDSDYTSPNDPAFRQAVFDLIYEGYFTIPYFISFQWIFNFWIATDGTANASPDPTDSRNLCLRQAPNNYEQRYAFADASGIVHTSSCRDNAGSPGVFTMEMEANRLQVVAHETGHRPFGLADEYCCDGGYFSSSKPVLSSDYKPPYPNLFKTENKCRDDAVNRPYIADDCRAISATDGETWWIGEPDYKALQPTRIDQVRDLMQGTGGTTDLDFNILDRYDAGDSEGDRLAWWLSKCVQGEC